MSVPQKEKEGPASMLRAVFAGFGSLLSVVDKVRSKPAAEAPAAAESPAPAPAPAAAAAPEPAAEPETATPETATPETVAAETATPEVTAEAEPAAAPETVAAETAVAETVTPEETAGEVAELPLANYDESTVASLRARLRNLSVDQLNQLIEYEKGHAARADVITMFERRVAKLEAEA
jgi:hypothetical protein